MTRKITHIALLVAAGAFLYSIETLIPMPVPWLRIGLANGVTLLALAWWGWKEGLAVVVVRVLVGSLLVGRVFQPVFFLALAGGIVSALCMFAMMRWTGSAFSLIGISIAGSVTKNLTQLLFAYFFLVRQIEMFRLAPVFLLTALFSGFLVGIITQMVHERWTAVARAMPIGDRP